MAGQVIVMVGTAIKGGISAVVDTYTRAGLFDLWPIVYVPSHRDGGLFQKVGTAIAGLAKLSRLLLLRQVAIVHIHVASNASFWRKSVFVTLARLARRPVILHFHSGGLRKFFDRQGRFRRRLVRAVLEASTYVLVFSEGWEVIVKGITPSANVLVVHNPVELDETSEQRCCNQTTGSLLFLGRIIPQKGIFDVVEALSRIVQEFPSLQLVIAGEGSSGEVLAAANSLGLRNRVHCVGWVDAKERHRLLNQATALVLPSYIEGMPMVVLEAMASGVPVVASTVGAIPEIVNDGEDGLLVDLGNIDDLTDKLRQVLGNEQLRVRLSQAGRKKVEESFAADQVIAKLGQLYSRLGADTAVVGGSTAVERRPTSMELKNDTQLARTERVTRPFPNEHTPSAGSHIASSLSLATWYWNRLRCMSIPEIGFRIGQTLNKKAQQHGFAIAGKVAPPDLARPARPFIALDCSTRADAYVASADRLLAGRIAVFDMDYLYDDLPQWNRDPKTGRVTPLVFGKNLDYRNEEVVGDIKYLWEINRHLELVTLAQAYRLTERKEYLDALRRLLESWLDQCPYLLGPNWVSSLELGIRLINWSIIWQLIGGFDSLLFHRHGGIAFRDRWLTSIYQHMHFIQGNFSRFSSANNHLIGEAAALYVGATAWPLWPATVRWRSKARRELIREVVRQNAPDGVNREQAISYQQFVLDFLVLAALAGRANGDDFPVEYWQRIERMLEFIAALIDVGGHVPMIGDADDGYMTRLSQEPDFCAYRSLLATGAALFRRDLFRARAGRFDDKSRWLLGRKGERGFVEMTEKSIAQPRRDFREGGYYVLGCDFGTPKEIRIIADAGPLGYQSIAAHGHADALSFVLSIAGSEFLIDPGTYAYHTERWWRDYFRGTAAHNTVRIDRQNQSVIGGAFMWTRHARIESVSWDTGPQSDRLFAAHDGYTRLTDPVRHERELVFDKGERRLCVSDVIACAERHVVECFWHFAEDVEVTVTPGGEIRAQKNGHELRLVPDYPVPLHVETYRGDIALPAGWISRRFGVKEPTTTVVWRTQVSERTRLRCSLECRLGQNVAVSHNSFDSLVPSNSP